MKLITLEEHYLDVRIARASAGIASHLSPDFNAAFDPALGISWSRPVRSCRTSTTVASPTWTRQRHQHASPVRAFHAAAPR